MSQAALPSAATTSREDLKQRLASLRDALLQGLVEREDAVRLALLGALSGEHLLLIGPPGTAKSLVARRLSMAFADATRFERLLTRFTVPEELFGPLSIKALEEDRYERQVGGYLPTATVAFLDEIFKANSAILNALLTLLNEREFDNGGERRPTPLVAVVGASNELPEGPELAALYDRFLLRLHVGPVSDAGFDALLDLRQEEPPEVDPALRLTSDELEAVRVAAWAVEVPGDVRELLRRLRRWLAEQQIPVSDRRWRRIVHLLQVSALTDGRDEVSVWDCWLLQHCTWDQPDQREAIAAWYEELVGSREAVDPARLTSLVGAWEVQLERERTDRAQARDEEGRLLFRDGMGRVTTESYGPMVQTDERGRPRYFAPSDARLSDRTNEGRGFTIDELDKLSLRVGYYHETFKEWDGRRKYLGDESNYFTVEDDRRPLLEPKPWSEAHVRQRLAEVESLRDRARAYLGDLERHREALEHTIGGHLWVDPAFQEPASRSLDATHRVVSGLLKRIDRLGEGFDGLPRQHPVEAA